MTPEYLSHHDLSAIHGAMAEFLTPEDLMAAAETAYASGYRKMDAYTPMPIEGLAEAIGYKKNYVAFAVLCAALSGATGGFLFLEWISGIAYAHNVGGRPLNSWPSFIPITFECTILFSAITSLLCVLLMNGLPKPYHPVFNVPEFARASTDRFFLCIESTDPKFRVEETVDFLRGLGGNEVSVVPA
jgi:hypothetical protein